MSFDEVVAQVSYLIQGQLRGGMGVEIGCLIEGIFGIVEYSFDGEDLRIDICAIKGGTLFGVIADEAGLDAVAIDQTWNFDGTIARQVGDEALVHDIAMDAEGDAGFHSFDDIRAVFKGASVGKFFVVNDLVALVFPIVNLFNATAGVFIERNIKLFD